MAEDINEEANELIVLENSYSKFIESVNYFKEVRQSASSSKMYQEECLKYYGHSKDNFIKLINGMDTGRYVNLISLKDCAIIW